MRQARRCLVKSLRRHKVQRSARQARRAISATSPISARWPSLMLEKDFRRALSKTRPLYRFLCPSYSILDASGNSIANRFLHDQKLSCRFPRPSFGSTRFSALQAQAAFDRGTIREVCERLSQRPTSFGMPLLERIGFTGAIATRSLKLPLDTVERQKFTLGPLYLREKKPLDSGRRTFGAFLALP